MFFWACILIRIVANPLSNVFQKLLAARSIDPIVIIFDVQGLLAIGCLPVLWQLPPAAPGFLSNVAFCVLLAVSSNALIVHALGVSDLSILGPINAFKPVVSLVVGALVLHERPGLWAILGIGLTVAGSYFLVDRTAGVRRRASLLRLLEDRGVRYRLAALILSATEAIFLEKAVHLSTPLTAFVGWCIGGLVVSLPAALLLSGWRRMILAAATLRSQPGSRTALVTTTGLMQLTTLVALGSMPAASVLGLFQTSIILGVLLGRGVFKEGNFVKRMIGAAIMAVGATLILIGGR